MSENVNTQVENLAGHEGNILMAAFWELKCGLMSTAYTAWFLEMIGTTVHLLLHVKYKPEIRTINLMCVTSCTCVIIVLHS